METCSEGFIYDPSSSLERQTVSYVAYNNFVGSTLSIELFELYTLLRQIFYNPSM